MFDSTYLILILPALLLSMFAQFLVKNAYSRYSRVDSMTGLTGAQVAKMILEKNGIHDVRVQQTPGVMTDHYDPKSKVVRLSEGVYQSGSLAAVSIAAHEVGHAIQKDQEYMPLNIRSSLVPLAGLGSNLSWIFIMGGLIFEVTRLINIGIALFSFAVLFQIVTLPVEFNASRRALHQLADGILPSNRMGGAKTVLRAAALTYVASALVAAAQLLRFILLTRRRND